ncbi:MAG: hypothetical protein RIS20_1014 [Bacteroidota bacterium]|jgi:hypothetical protein
MKTKIYSFKTVCSFILSMIFAGAAHAQCFNTSSYPTGGATAPTATTITTQISTCSFQAEYSQLNNVDAATIYQCAIAQGGFITITQGSPTGSVIASGNSPLQWNSTVAGTYYAHWTVDAACTQAFNCVTTSITYISPATACTNPVLGGTTTASPAAACPSQNFSLALTGATLGTGLSYQWQSAPTSNGPWTNITGATSGNLTTQQAVDTYYHCIVTCSAGSTGTSTPVLVTMNPFYNCYCNSAATVPTADEEIYNVTVNGGSTDPLYSNANGCASAAPGPGSILGGYSNFKSLPAITSVITGQSVAFSISQDECDGGTYYANGIGIWVDFNQNGIFTDLGEDVFVESTTTAGPRVVTGTFNIPITAVPGNTAIRIVCAEGYSSTSFTPISPCLSYGYGETEDYLINIVPAATCSGTITGGTTVTSATPVCPSTTVTLSTTGSTLASGITYQWQSAATATGPWTNITGATSNTYATTVNADTYFQLVMTCTASGSTAISTPVLVGSNPFFNCYCNTVNAGGDGSLMDEVSMNGYVNNTAATNPTASPFYTAFTNGPSVIQGMDYTLDVTVQAPSVYTGAIVSVWIDYDHNGAYEPTEWTQVGTNISSATTGSVNITIPITALTGNTGMRIRSRGAGNINGAGDACTNMGSGETEDYIINILPAPICANPTNIVVNTEIDSIITNWTWNQTILPSTGFNMQLVNAGSAFSTGTTYVLDNNFSDTLFDANFMAGQSFQMYLQTVCGQDTSYFIGPFNVVMPLSNDTICGAQMLPVNNVMHVFNNNGASIDANEIAMVPPVTGAQTETGWENQNLNLTTWFKFIAPPSGSVRVNCTGMTYNGQAAVYSTSACDNIASFQMISANDNDMMGTSVAPNFTACGLTPGNTYYILHDAFDGTSGNYGIAIKEIILNAGVQGEVLQICYGDTVNLFNGIANYQTGGVWTQTIPTLGLQGNLFITNGLASIPFTFTYTLTDGCANDSSPAEVDVFPPSQAGLDGAFTVCKNEPFNLLQGLGGIVDLGGTWYDPSNNPLAGNLDTAANIPGFFNYDYIVGNGVCPDDTSNVLVTVDGTCDFTASIGDVSGSFEMYPNPTADVLNIVNGMDFTIENIQVLDMQGKVVVLLTKGNFANDSIQLNMKQLETGVYMIRLNGTDKTIINRVVKQ